MTLGEKIKIIRLNLGLTTKDFGAKLMPPASDSLVSRWERGVNRPNSSRIRQIARLGCTTTKNLLSGVPSQMIDEILKENDQLKVKLQQIQSVLGGDA